jgi:hypothetical protein
VSFRLDDTRQFNAALDRHITGNWGEDQMKGDETMEELLNDLIDRMDAAETELHRLDDMSDEIMALRTRIDGFDTFIHQLIAALKERGGQADDR